ncbi:MAG: winged helix-turn-helix transcriptional regulator [Candidatus Thermoplasmatota archaeon]|nr:winged helix-turn-helix transcriptional regulator [Candidatus Thermoplasmatota archaeon]
MDETDIRLCQMLFTNSRIPIRELADRLDISVQATHRRMQILKDEGIVCGFRASLSLGYLHAIRVLIEGISKGRPEEVEKALRSNEMVQSIFIGEGQPQYFLEAIIRDITDLDPFVTFLRNEANIPTPNVLFHSQVLFGKKMLDTGYKGPSELSRLDYQIVNALHEDARISVGDLAIRCNASARTVTRHLDKLIEDGAVYFGVDWCPGNASGMTAMLAILLKENADPMKVRNDLNQRFGGSLFNLTMVSNIAGLISSYAWSPSIKRYNELLDAIKGSDGVVNVLSTVLRNGWVQDTWRDKFLKEKAEDSTG